MTIHRGTYEGNHASGGMEYRLISISLRGKRPSELPGAPVAAVHGQYLTVAQAAVVLKVSPRRVRALVTAGALRARAVNPRLLLIRRADLKYVAVRSPGRPCL